MKQLLLYFLFFVAAAIILVQCAKFFPTTDKPAKLALKSQGNIDSVSHQHLNILGFSVKDPAGFKAIFNHKTTIHFFKNPLFPFNKNARKPLFNNAYYDASYSRLANQVSNPAPDK